MKLYRVRAIGMALMLLLVACGTVNPSNSASENSQMLTAPTTVADTTTTTDNRPAGDVWNGNEFANKLDTLDSYTATFTYTATSNGKESTWVWQQKIIYNPVTMEIRTNPNGADIQSADYHMVKIADKMYSVTDNPSQCIIVVNQPENQGLNPNSIIGNIPFTMQKTGTGPDVMGHTTIAYAYTGTTADGSNYQSTALVERNDGYALRWEVTGKTKTGDALEPFSWKYELTDINTVAPITLPNECENLASDSTWPMPDGAQITMQTNQMVALTSDKSVQELTDFYTTAMKDAGYAPSEGGMNAADTSMLMFTKDDKNITVMISLQEGKGMVIITQQ